jgi:hypothetical protein
MDVVTEVICKPFADRVRNATEPGVTPGITEPQNLRHAASTPRGADGYWRRTVIVEGTAWVWIFPSGKTISHCTW